MKKVLIFGLMLILMFIGGCGIMENKESRSYMEKHFSYLEKTYFVKNIDELYTRYPNGARLTYSYSEENEQKDWDTIDLELSIDPVQKRIYGTETKRLISAKSAEVIYTEDVEYKDEKIVYLNNASRESYDIRFLFNTLTYQDITANELKLVNFRWSNNRYMINYWIPKEKASTFLGNLHEEDKVYLSLEDIGRQDITLELSSLKYYREIKESIKETKHE